MEKKGEIINKKILFVIPAYNEELNIGKVIEEINESNLNVDMVVVNDCSKDGTEDIVKSKRMNCVTLPFNMGYAMACQTGFKYAVDNGYDLVVQFDADGQHIVEEVEKLLNKMREDDLDIVIGSRFLESNNYRHGLLKKMGTKIFCGLISLFCKEKITDPTSGFQLLKKEVFTKYSKMGAYPDYPDANLIIEMLLGGYKIGEVGVLMRKREIGESMHDGILKPMKYMVDMTYSIVIILILNLGRKFRTKRRKQ